MAIPTYSGDTDYISQLGDNPNVDNNLTPTALKAKFDAFGTAFKAWFNGTFVPTLQQKLTSTNKLNGAYISDGTVDTDQLHANAVTAAKMASGAAAGNLGSGSVTYAKLNADAKPVSGRKQINTTDWTEVTEDAVTFYTVTVDYSDAVVFGSSDYLVVSPRATTQAFEQWRNNGVHCIDQTGNTLTFRAETKPNRNMSVDVLVVR